MNDAYTVKELIEALQKLDQDSIIVMSSDPEGNSYDTLCSIEPMMYADGEIGYDKLTPELKKHGYTEEDLLTDGRKAVVFWP